MIKSLFKKYGKLSFSMINFTSKNSIFPLNQKFFCNLNVDHDFKALNKQIINEENVNKIIDDWVKNNKVCLFMKGVPDRPQCGFSRYVVQVMKLNNIKEYKSVNILENAILREAVKKYSNWPTYPQLYINGSLIGM